MTTNPSVRACARLCLAGSAAIALADGRRQSTDAALASVRGDGQGRRARARTRPRRGIDGLGRRRDGIPRRDRRPLVRERRPRAGRDRGRCGGAAPYARGAPRVRRPRERTGSRARRASRGPCTRRGRSGLLRHERRRGRRRGGEDRTPLLGPLRAATTNGPRVAPFRLPRDERVRDVALGHPGRPRGVRDSRRRRRGGRPRRTRCARGGARPSWATASPRSSASP